MNASVALLLMVLHGLEAVFWALVYMFIGAFNMFSEAIFYSIDTMTTRGASGLVLQTRWEIMRALESMSGMLMFGLSTALIFAMMQRSWGKLIIPAKAR